MANGELFRNGWLWQGSMVYAHENGVFASGTVIEERGKYYYTDMQSGHAFEILCGRNEYSIAGGFFTVSPGYVGKPLESTSHFLDIGMMGEPCSVRWESDDSSVASVDEKGVITAKKEGLAFISAHFYRDSDGVYMGSSCVYGLYVWNDNRQANYSDNRTDHVHVYKEIVRPATCGKAGYTIYTCAQTDCAHSNVADYVEAIGHNYESVVTAPTCSAQGYTTHTCANCGDSYVDSYTDPLPYIPGDADGDGTVNTDDAIYLLYNVMFGDEDYPVNQNCDFDGNGSVNTDDAIYLLYYVMFGEEDYPLH